MSFSDNFVFVILLVVGILARIPFIENFDLVAYDGTYYINQAKSFLGWSEAGGSFPVGYPALIALFLPLVRDGVRAAQAVSLLAAIGSAWILFLIARRHVSRFNAFLAALLLVLTPLFLRLSMMTLSESVFVFWLLLGLLFYERRKYLAFSLTMGVAAITRPEALGIFVVLAILRRRPLRRLAVMGAAFLVVYAVNLVALSVTLDRVVVVPKTEFFGTSASNWKGREAWGDFSGRDALEETLEPSDKSSFDLFVDSVRRMPREAGTLGRHVMPAAVLLAIFGMLRKRLYLIACFLPFLLYPIFTVRAEARYIFPYVPFLIVYAVIGLEAVSPRRLRLAAAAALAVSAAAGFVVNLDQLTTPVSEGFAWAKKAGSEWNERIGKEKVVADRKPFFAFYAGARYEEIPVAPYDAALGQLSARKVDYLSLHKNTIDTFRPALKPLLYDAPTIRGEIRFEQVDAREGIQLLYKRSGPGGQLVRKRLTPAEKGLIMMPAWSPDGRLIAYRKMTSDDRGEVRVIGPDGEDARTLVEDGGARDPLAWSPDSRKLAYANRSMGALDVFVLDIATGESVRATWGGASNRSPSWSADGSEIVFASDRTGSEEIWAVEVSTGRIEQITDGDGGIFPAASPVGRRIAWIRPGRGVGVLDRDDGRTVRFKEPRDVRFAPAWSRDGAFIAVTATDWGGSDVYIINVENGEGALLTKYASGEGMPSWGPGHNNMVIVSNQDEDFGLWLLAGVEPYLERLKRPYEIRTLKAD